METILPLACRTPAAARVWGKGGEAAPLSGLARTVRHLFLLGVCVAAGFARAKAEDRVLSVAAAANLKTALDPVIVAFKATRHDVDVRPTYGASGAFVTQIENGAPFDIFLAADLQYPAKVVASRLSIGEPLTYAFGRLVLWVPTSSKLDIEKQGLAVLLDPAVLRVALGNPALAPYGVAAEEALKSAALYDRLKGKFVLGESVGQAAQFAESGNAQAAFLPQSLAMAPPLDKAGRYVLVPDTRYHRIAQAGVILKATKEPELARAFMGFLTGAPGRAILARNGYGLPPE